MKRRRRSWARAALALLALEAAAVLAASRLELYRSWGLSDPELGWRFHGGNEHARWYQPEPPARPLPPPRAPETLFLGDSVIRAGNIPRARLPETIAAVAGGFNAGVDGYGTFQQRRLFRRELKALQPRRVALVVCLNDIMSAAEDADAVRLTRLENFQLDEPSWLEHEGFARLWRWLRARAARERWAGDDPEPGPDAHPRVMRLELDGARPVRPDVWSEWTAELLRLRDDAAPARFLIVLAPLRPHARAWREGRRDFWVPHELAAFCRKNGIPFLDLLPVLGEADVDPRQAFTDPFHLSILGHRAAALAVRRFLAAHPPAAREPVID
jgi:hypothetical protein